MAEQQQTNDIQYLLSDLNTRIRDAEERNKITKERTLILSKNLIDNKEEVSTQLQELKSQNFSIEQDINKLKKTTQALIAETAKYVKREEILLVERMLKDFQPLEFARMQDVQRLIDEKMHQHKK